MESEGSEVKRIIIIALVVVAAAAAGFGIYKLVNKPETSNQSTVAADANHNHDNHSHDEATSNSEATAVAAEEVTITYTNNGYSPKTVTVKAGGKVTVKNDSSRNMQFDSDPHPAHTDNQELNAEVVKAGESETFTVMRTGTFGYHNHLNASETGTIIAKK